MKIQIKKYLTVSLFCLIVACELYSQTVWQGKVEIDKSQHDFGDVVNSDGVLSCSFSLKNVGSQTFTILKVVSSCGCTDVQWTKSTVGPGDIGTISAKYENKDKPGAFEKTLTAYLDIFEKPLVFKLKGTVREKRLPLEEAYPYHFGPLGLRQVETKGPNVEQGQPRGGEILVANLSENDMSLDFKNVSDGLDINFPQRKIRAREIARISYLITPDENKWGRQIYYATPLVNGKEYPCKTAALPKSYPDKGAESYISETDTNLGDGKTAFGIRSWTKASTSSLTAVQKASGPTISFEESSYNFRRVDKGTVVKASFKFRVSGRGELKIYAIDSDTHRLKAKGPSTVKSGETGTITISFDTTGLPPGEVLSVVTLTTSSPARPLVNLYISGFIK